MLLLTTTNDKLTLTTSASASIKVHGSYVDNLSGAITPGRTNPAAITGIATTDIVAAPASSTQRNVRHLNIRNDHASTSCDVTVNHTDGTTTAPLMKCTLLPGEELVLDQSGSWTHYDQNGGIYPAVLQAATQADMEAATSLTAAVVPGRQHFHPGMAKFVCMTTGTATPVMQTPPSYNVTSITDNGVGRLLVTIATDFSSANWCCGATCEQPSTTLTDIGNVADPAIRNGTLAAGSVEVEAHDQTTTTAARVDPPTWHVWGYGDQA